MNPTLLEKVKKRLIEDYQFVESKGALRQGECPDCRKKELYSPNADAPWVLHCGRLNNCGTKLYVKDIYDDLFNDWSKNFPKTPANPNATADKYLTDGRGFELSKIKGWYSQEYFHHTKKNIGSATVRFAIAGQTYWERLIDRPERFGSQKANFSGGYKGLWWQAPDADLFAATEIWIAEGVFDAIALMHAGKTAVSAMSVVNYPAQKLQEIADHHHTNKTERPYLVWAFDEGAAGSKYMREFVERSTKDGWQSRAAQIKSSQKYDWNDLHKKGLLNQKTFEEALYQGDLLTAQTAEEKALLMYNHTERGTFFFRFKNRMYWFSLNMAAFSDAMEDVDPEMEQDDPELFETTRNTALKNSKSLYSICNCYPQALYYQRNAMTDEAWYYFRVDFPHDGKAIKNTLTGAQITSVNDFKKRLITMAPGAMFKGKDYHLAEIIEQQTYGIKVVEAIDFIGYSKEHKTYVFDTFGVANGRLSAKNNDDYIQCGKHSIKTLDKSTTLTINTSLEDFKQDWPKTLWLAFRENGLIALTFFFGSLFAEQIRSMQGYYTFLEVVGEPGAGKSTLIEFLWKLLGRDDYEGFDPSKSSHAARARNFSRVSNIPVSLIESERDDGDKKSHTKGFDFRELKTAFNGRSIVSRGVKSAGNETYEPPFRASILISQNAAVDSELAILERIVHVYCDKRNHSDAGEQAGEKLKQMTTAEVSGFLVKAVTKESAILKRYQALFDKYAKALASLPDLKNRRVRNCHAQMMALLNCLPLVVDIPESYITDTEEVLMNMASKREKDIGNDHADLQVFWDAYEYLNGDIDQPRLNHSADPNLIAINLNHFEEMAGQKRQDVPSMKQLKKLLKDTKTHKFIGVKPVHSAINKARNQQTFEEGNQLPKTVKCWVFETKQKGLHA